MRSRKPFVAVVGAQNSGKSTVIRSLTGARSGQFRGVVHDLATQETIVVIGSSPQEQSLTLAQLRAKLRSALGRPKCRGVVCALQPSYPHKRLSLEQVLLEAQTLRFQIYAYVLDPAYNGAKGYAKAVIARTKKLGVRVKTLDGRRFAQVNAAEINRRAKIVA